MVLIFGGAYQGKLAFALEKFNLAESDVHECDINDAVMPKNKKVIYEIDKWILALLKKELDVEAAIQQFINYNKDAIIICNDISCGVVPFDSMLRKWREETGRSMVLLSQKSDEVVRLFCGLPTRIK